jgi:hypothetical protein
MIIMMILIAVSGRTGAWPWPGVEDLLFLKLVSVIFPTTGTAAFSTQRNEKENNLFIYLFGCDLQISSTR